MHLHDLDLSYHLRYFQIFGFCGQLGYGCHVVVKAVVLVTSHIYDDAALMNSLNNFDQFSCFLFMQSTDRLAQSHNRQRHSSHQLHSFIHGV